MSKPFDVVLKVMVEAGPEGWPAVLIHLPGDGVWFGCSRVRQDAATPEPDTITGRMDQSYGEKRCQPAAPARLSPSLAGAAGF
jgi:hypothetical protein